MTEKKYTLDDVDGNAYAIMAYVRSAMKREGKSNARTPNLEDNKPGITIK